MSMPEMDPKLIEALNKYRQPVSTVDEPLYLKATLYGDGGVGKTVLSCRFGKTLLFSTDTGWAVTKNKFNFDLDVDFTTYQEPEHFRTVAKAIRLGVSGWDNYDTVVIDTISGLTEEYLDWLLQHVDLPKRSLGTYKNPRMASEKKLKPLEAHGWDDYSHAKVWLRPAIRDLMIAPVNVFLIAHEKENDPFKLKNDKDTGKLLPDLPDKVYKLCHYNTHLMARMIREGDKRSLIMETNPKFAAKSRIQALDGKKVTDEEFITAINNWRNK